jgi:hypothetical protein
MDVSEKAPECIWLHDLREMLLWYKAHLCAPNFLDFRGHRVQFRDESFPHLIKLLQKDSTREVKNPQKHILEIQNGTATNADYGGYQAYRFRRFTALPMIIERPDSVLELTGQRMVGKKRSGDTLYIKQFLNVPRSCRFEILVCRRVAGDRLEVVTCHPQDHGNYSRSEYKQIYPP